MAPSKRNRMQSKITDGRSAFNRNLKTEDQAASFALARIVPAAGATAQPPKTIPFSPLAKYCEGHRFVVFGKGVAYVTWRKWSGVIWVYTVMRSWDETPRTYTETELPEALSKQPTVTQVSPSLMSLSDEQRPNYYLAPDGAKTAVPAVVRPGDHLCIWSLAWQRWVGGMIALTTCDKQGGC